MRGCERFGGHLDAYHDGELGPEPARAFADHLGECPDCRGALERRSELDASLRALPGPEPSAQFEAQLWARLARAEPAAPPLWRRLLAGPRPLLLAAAGAGAAVALYLSVPGITRDELPPLVGDAETFELLLEGDLELLSSLEVLEAWEAAEGA